MKTVIIMYIMLLNSFAYALTLNECIDKAINTHPDVRNASLDVSMSEASIKIAKADYLPQITLNGEYNPTRTYVFPTNGTFNTKDSDGLSVGAIVNQKIWDFSKTTSNIEAQRVSKDAQNLTLEDVKALLAYRVKLQYELILVQIQAIKVREKDLKVKEELYKQAEAFVHNGMKTIADSTRFLSSVYQAKDNLAIAKASFEKARVTLSLYIGEPIPADVILQNTLNNHTLFEMDEKKIVHNSLILKSLQKSIQKESLNYKAVKASHYGSLDGVASYTHQNTLNEYDSTLVGITLKIPLYSGGRTTQQVQQAMINREKTEAMYASKKLEIREEFESLRIDIKRYAQTIKAKESQIEASNQTQELLEARYKEGLSTYIEVLDAHAITLDAELTLLQAIYERSSAIHRIEYLQGKII